MEYQFKDNVPYSVAVLVLGICSIVVSNGWICGIIALVLAHKGLEQYKLDPEKYKSPQMLKAGQICAIIGISLRGLILIIGIIAAIIWGIGNIFECEGFFDIDTVKEVLQKMIDKID
ncbi:MAG: DUF4190 domain-containing protein [Bacteroidales bacterium]|jgi:hypothetical protein|nr:DUF4190 domain-containing protein [Bacteroidales bacterium]